MAGQPVELALKLTRYLVENKIRGRRRFPLTMIFKPLEKCNLACEGCDPIREYESVIDRTMTVEDCLTAVEECGASRQTVVPRGTWITLLGDASKGVAWRCTLERLPES